MPKPKHSPRPWGTAAAAGAAAYVGVFLLEWGSCLWAVYQAPLHTVLAGAWAWHLHHARFVAWLQASHSVVLVQEAWCFTTIAAAVGLFVSHSVLNPPSPSAVL